jgi:predicted RNA binding protein YcfA (HicA-like mRNA interferase family)
MGYGWKRGMTAKEVISTMIANDWELKRIKGSQHIFVKNGVSLIVPFHRALSTGVLESIKKQVNKSESGTL